MRRTHRPPAKLERQRGAAGIEFVLIFTIFFGVFYAILGYAFLTLMYQGLIQAAAEGARAAVKLDKASYDSDFKYQQDCGTLAKNAAVNALNWMPSKILDQIKASGVSTSFTTSNTTISAGVVSMTTITVRVTYANYAAQPLIPILTLPGLGPIPNVPTDLVGSSTLRVY